MSPPSRIRILGLLIPVLLAIAATGSAQAQAVVVDKVHDGLNFPSTIKFAPDGRLFYLETFTGRVMYYADTSAVDANEWATIPIVAKVEQGLLGMAFHPQFPDSPYVYFYHTNLNPYFNRVVRMTDSSGIGTNYCVIFDGLSCLSNSHEGGRLAFGPDGMLYVTVGDQWNSSNSQDLSTPLGKILRLTPMGRPAPGNPFGPLNPAIVYGIRNSYGLCFDPLTGYGYFTDNGPDCDDELNFFQFAANYGWGPDDLCGSWPEGTMPPLWMTTPTIAPTGVTVYRGQALAPYNGDVFFTGYNDGNVRRAVIVEGHPDQVSSVDVLVYIPDSGLDITEGPDQRLWVSTITGIWRITLPILASESRSGPEKSWHPGPSPFTDHVGLAPQGGERLRRIDVLDVAGRRLRSFSGPFGPTAQWDGRDEGGRILPAGVYLVRGELFSGRPITRSVVRLAR